MAWYSLLILSTIPVFFYLYLYIPIEIEPPEIDKDGFFGMGDSIKDDETIDPFTIKFITQVKEMTRFAFGSIEKFEEDSFERRIASNLAKFNWDQHAHFINSFSHYTTEIEGLSIHFVHISLDYDKKVNRIPILLLPSSFSSFWNFFKLFPILSNPSRHGFEFGLKDPLVFDVIIPSYPMTLFSHPSLHNSIDKVSVSRILNKLMTKRLSYSKYFVYGDGGIGSEIASIISTVFPSDISGLIIHDPIMSMEGIKRQLQLYLLPSDSIQTQIDHCVSFPPPLNDLTFTTTLKYLIERWRDSSQSIDLDREVTLDEITTSFSLFILTKSLESHINLLTAPIPSSILEATTFVPTFVISSRNNKCHIPRSLLNHKFLNLTRYDEISRGGILFSLSKSTEIAQKIFSFVEVC
ncbi:hypothetical protein PRIPAC_85688 [Pristionchus pacificus]|uniref:EHN domain-containing protein n=1 Tax=Pristionchus pacificus TaxID=54126 RepID=A0A2A6CCX0_PRIPA|nr:hypothetical protein PRIPAC_85688 [Pristionchus pacificus]|eukprot:PDM75940.1 hypothetical protein PRIPAC_43783 [Pristionchus pacificus]